MRKKLDLAAAMAASQDHPAVEMTLSELVLGFNTVTVGDYDWRLKKWIDAFGSSSAWAITSEQLEAAAQAMLAHGYKPSAVNRDLSALGTCYRWIHPIADSGAFQKADAQHTNCGRAPAPLPPEVGLPHAVSGTSLSMRINPSSLGVTARRLVLAFSAASAMSCGGGSDVPSAPSPVGSVRSFAWGQLGPRAVFV